MTARRRFLCLSVALLVLGTLGACGGGGSGAAAPSLTYVGLGASDAVGIGAIPTSEGYVYELEGFLQGLPADVTLQNLGISGARVEDIIAEELPVALGADPDVVTLWTGANDIVGGADPATFGQRLDGMLRDLAARTDAQIFVGDLPDLTLAPIFRTSPDPDVTTARLDAFNAEIHAAVEAHGCVLVPLSTVTFTDDLFFIDGFHPNNAGYDVMAEEFWAEMAPRL